MANSNQQKPSLEFEGRTGNTASRSIAPDQCGNCHEPLRGQFVRALGACYHLNCFKCADCGQVVAARFFPLEQPDKVMIPLCERDYFRRQDLLCANCGEAIRGSYISAIGKKFHLDHFTCSMCSVVFGPDETYYEHSGSIYCHYHYSTKFSSSCGGCKMSILKQFVEVKSGNNEQWHPECYMIYKSWNVRMAGSSSLTNGDVSNPEQLKLTQQVMEEKVNRIWTVLSAFEESAAACISDMLIHVSSQAYIDSVNEAGNFILHVDVLFSAIDDLESEMAKYNDSIGISYSKEPKLLAKKVVNLFSLLSHTQDSARQYGTATQELLSLVTSLAQYMKIMIRLALAGALKLERKHGSKTAIGDFLSKLIDLGPTDLESINQNDVRFDERYMLSNIDVSSDLCISCRTSVEEACIGLINKRWHKKCFNCKKCRKELADSYKAAFYDSTDFALYCSTCTKPGASKGFEKVSQLNQYTYLLRVALKRLISLLKVKDDLGTGGIFSAPMKISNSTSSEINGSGSLPVNSRSASLSQLDPALKNEGVTDVRQSVYQAITGQQPGGSSSTATGNRQGTTVTTNAVHGSIHNIVEFSPDGKDDPMSSQQMNQTISTSLPNFNATGIVARSQEDARSKWPMAPESTKPSTPMRPLTSGQSRQTYLAELSGLEYFMARNVAVLRLHPLVHDQYTINELLSLIREQKRTFWSKFISTLTPKKQTKVKDGTFGVPLDVVIDRCGVDSKHGSGLGRIIVPHIIDSAITAMKSMDLRAEGIFRKNGNIKNLNALQAKVDKDTWDVNLTGESPIQLAALIKKYLRELPEPLLTFKLYKLFVLSQKASNLEARKKILHFTVCLLPKQNRDLLEVLMVFLRDVASFASAENGNKMDIPNLATVIAPNILFSKTKEKSADSKAKDESFQAIDTVRMIMEYQDTLWKVPDDICEFMQNEEIPEDVNAYTAKDIMDRFEKVMSTKKSHSSREVFVDRQHSATGSAAILNSRT